MFLENELGSSFLADIGALGGLRRPIGRVHARDAFDGRHEVRARRPLGGVLGFSRPRARKHQPSLAPRWIRRRRASPTARRRMRRAAAVRPRRAVGAHSDAGHGDEAIHLIARRGLKLACYDFPYPRRRPRKALRRRRAASIRARRQAHGSTMPLGDGAFALKVRARHARRGSGWRPATRSARHRRARQQRAPRK